MDILQKYFGSEVREQFVSGLMTRWGTDPYSMGSYSFMAKGALPEVTLRSCNTVRILTTWDQVLIIYILQGKRHVNPITVLLQALC